MGNQGTFKQFNVVINSEKTYSNSYEQTTHYRVFSSSRLRALFHRDGVARRNFPVVGFAVRNGFLGETVQVGGTQTGPE